MKVLYRFLLLLGYGTLAVPPAVGQITITAGDVGAFLAAGNSITSRVDTGTHTADIGSLGATSWDFSGLVQNFTITTMCVDPSTTPFAAEYPAATHAVAAGTGFSYYDLGTNIEMLGYAQPPPTQIRRKLIPPQVLNQLPMTMGTNWTSSYTDSSYVTIGGTTFPSVSNHVVMNTVDAYGTLMLPGGVSVQAIRLKNDRSSTTGGNSFRSITYQIVSKSGASATLVASDTNQPATGTINVSNINWVVPGTGTAVHEIAGGALPGAFALEQNYPNPFNPSTTIRFSAAENAFVSVAIYDLLGREISTLVSERLSPGNYSVEWDASGLPSGVYICRMQSGELTETRRLVLTR